MALRVVQWATGEVGVAAINGVLGHPDLELVGCWVHSADKAGKDVGEIIGAQPLGILATTSLDDIQAIKLVVDTIGFNADPTVRSSQ